MRELTLEELELVAGGTETITVVAPDGDGGGDWGGDWGGDYGGDYGGGDGGGDGGGGGGDPPPADPDPSQDIVVTAPKPAAQCPVNDWYPNMWEDWGDVTAISPPMGPWTQYWHDQGTWCFYDANDNLQGKFVDDPKGTETLTFSSNSGTPTFNVGAATVSGGYADNDSSAMSITFHVSRVDE